METSNRVATAWIGDTIQAAIGKHPSDQWGKGTQDLWNLSEQVKKDNRQVPLALPATPDQVADALSSEYKDLVSTEHIHALRMIDQEHLNFK